MNASSRNVRDEWLVLRCQAGEANAFADLVSEMERPLLYYVTKLLGDTALAFDVLQELWLRVLRGLGRLDTPASLRPWLYRLAHGLVVDQLRKRGSVRRAEQAYAECHAESGEDESDTFLQAEDVHRALDQLETLHREVLLLHFLEGMSLKDIAEVVGCPEGTVKSRLHYAKKSLRQQLGGGHASQR